MNSLSQKIFLLIFIGVMLQGCVALLGGAAVGAAGAAIIYDRRDVNTMMSDEKLSRQVLLALEANEQIKQQCHIVVSTYRGMVLIAGQAPTEELKQTINNIAKKEVGKQLLYNEVTIDGPTTALTRTSDSWITTKVKTKLIDTPGLKSGEFKVVTENGVVYLMGVVSKSQAQLATNTAKMVGGVQKVVTIFQYQQNIDPEVSAVENANISAETHDNSVNSNDSSEIKPGKTKYIGI